MYAIAECIKCLKIQCQYKSEVPLLIFSNFTQSKHLSFNSLNLTVNIRLTNGKTPWKP